MSINPPPDQISAIFNPVDLLSSANDAITREYADNNYLKFPLGQGTETIPNLNITGEVLCSTAPSSNSSLTNKLYVDNVVIGGSILPTNNVFTGTNAFNTFLPTSTLTPSSGTELTTKTFVDGAISTASTAYAKLGSANAFTSTNTFNSSLPTSILTPSSGTELTTKTFVDSSIATASNDYAKLASANTFTSTNAFNTFLPTSTLTPSSGTQLTTKAFVDGAIATASNDYAKLTSANIFTSTNAFNTFLPTSTLTPSSGTELTTKTFVDSAIATAIAGVTSGYVSISGTDSISGQKTFTNANTIIQNTLTTDTISGSAVGTAVSLYNEATRTGRIDLGIGADARDIYIGNNTVIGSSTTRVRGCGVKIEANQEPLQITGNGLLDMVSVGPMTIQAGNTQNISIGNNMTNTATFQIGGTAGGSALYKIANGNSQTGTIDIGTGTGTKIMNVGGTATTLNLKGSSVALGNDVTSGNIDIGGGLTSGNLSLGSGAGQVNISTNATNSTAVAICNNSSANNTSIVTIGKNSALKINNDTGDVNLSTAETNAGGLTICTDATSTRTINIGRGNAISIANSATPTTTLTGSVRINDGGSASSQIGNNSAIPVNIIGTVKINAPTNTQSTEIGNSTGTITMIGNTSMTGDITITQTTYPPSATTAIGYTIQKTFGPANASDTTGTYANIGSQALGTVKGVYFISCGFSLTASGNDTMNNKAVILSLTSGTSDVPVNDYGAWEYYDEINDSIGGSGGLRYVGTLCGVYTKTVTTAQTLYLNAYANTTGGVTISVQGNCSITRIA